MEPKFHVIEYYDITDYPKRFAKAIYLDYIIIMDMWTGLINITKFCQQFPRKEFYNFIRDKEEREDFSQMYAEIVPLKENWQNIYVVQDSLYMITSNQPEIQHLRGSYAYYKSFIKVALWCNKALKYVFYDLLIHLSNLYNSSILDKYERKIENITVYLSTFINDRERGKMSEKEIFDLLCEEFPDEKFTYVADHHNTADIKCGNILIEIKNSKTGFSKQNIAKLIKDLYTQSAPLGIIISFYGSSNIDFQEKIIFVNIREIHIFKDMLSAVFKKYKDKSQLLAPTDDTVTNEDIEKLTLKTKCLKTYLPDYSLDKLKEKIDSLPDSNKRKAHYKELFDKGEYKKLPKNLLK